MPKGDLKRFVEKYPFTTGVIRKTPIDLTSDFIDRKITIAGWQTILAECNFDVCSHLTYKIHSQNNAAIPLLPFCSIEDKWIKEIYLTNDLAQPGVIVDFIIVNPPTKLNYTGIYSQTIDTEGSITAILNSILTKFRSIPATVRIDDLSTASGGIIYTFSGGRIKILQVVISYTTIPTGIYLALRWGATDTRAYFRIQDATAGSYSIFGIGLQHYLDAVGSSPTAPLPNIWLDCENDDLELNLYYTGGTNVKAGMFAERLAP